MPSNQWWISILNKGGIAASEELSLWLKRLNTAGEFVQPVSTVLEALGKLSISRQVVRQGMQDLPGLTGDALANVSATATASAKTFPQVGPDIRERVFQHYQRLAQGGLVKGPASNPILRERQATINPYQPMAALSANRLENPAAIGRAGASSPKTWDGEASQALMNDDRFAAQLERILERTRRKRLQ